MATVLLVMKQPGNTRVMAQALATTGHTAVSAPNHTALMAALAQSGECRIGLVDASGFSPADWQMCQTLHSHGVHFIVLCAPQEIRQGGQALLHGATSLLQKPVKKPMLLQLISGLAEKAALMQPEGN